MLQNKYKYITAKIREQIGARAFDSSAEIRVTRYHPFYVTVGTLNLEVNSDHRHG